MVLPLCEVAATAAGVSFDTEISQEKSTALSSGPLFLPGKNLFLRCL
jgi:hypothetical protein